MGKKEVRITILLFLMIITMSISMYLHFSITRPNEINYVEQTKTNLNPVVRFDYINGLWLSFSGAFFVFLLVFVDLFKKDVFS